MMPMTSAINHPIGIDHQIPMTLMAGMPARSQCWRFGPNDTTVSTTDIPAYDGTIISV